MRERTVKDFFLIFKKRLWLIVTMTIVFVLISGINNFYGDKKDVEYEALKTLIVDGPKGYFDYKNGDFDYEAYKAINDKFLAHFNELIKMDIVIDEAIENLGLDISYKEFRGNLDVEVIDKTELMKIKVKNKDPELAVQIIDELTTVALKKANKIMGIENVKEISETKVKSISLKSKTKREMGISGMLGFSISILIILILEYLDKTIKSPKDIENYFNLPVIGMIYDTAVDLVADRTPNSLVAENYRTLATNVESIKNNKSIKTILITSPSPSESKSLVASNLAITIAKSGEKVLLIDGDLRRPSIHKIFNIDNNFGLTDILNKELNHKGISDKIVVENNLHILSSGSTAPNPGELLTIERIEKLLKTIKDEYDTIIFNSPSLGVLVDPIIISTVVDSTILVCTSEKTEFDEISKGKNLLEKVNADILGVVLDGVELDNDDYYKYYYNSYIHYKDNIFN